MLALNSKQKMVRETLVSPKTGKLGTLVSPGTAVFPSIPSLLLQVYAEHGGRPHRCCGGLLM